MYSSTDPLTSAVFFVVLVASLAIWVSMSVPFWIPYLLVLLFLSGILVVLLFMCSMSKPYFFKKGLPLILLLVGGYPLSYFTVSFYEVYSFYCIMIFLVIGFSLYLFLLSCYMLLFRKSALRMLLYMFSLACSKQLSSKRESVHVQTLV